MTANAGQAELEKRLLAAGFEVKPDGGNRMTIRKNHCSYRLERSDDGTWMTAGPPRLMIRGLEYELEDQGYQKFWFAGGKRFAIRLQQLRDLHDFDRGVRALLGLKALYHESLGTTSARTVYDRLEGRPHR